MPNLIVLTGAGVSAESGIPTFRASDGLWEEHDVMDVAHIRGFRKNPALVHRFYNERRALLPTVQPNAAHVALAKLEEGWRDKGDFLLITQNIDDLHERGGSTDVAHMHGELLSIRCSSCSHDQPHSGETSVETACPVCSMPMRPNVVWFGEMPYYLGMIEPRLQNCDVFIVIGTSGQVYPAAGFVDTVRDWNPGARIIEINPQPTGNEAFTEVIAASATQALPPLVEELLAL